MARITAVLALCLVIMAPACRQESELKIVSTEPGALDSGVPAQVEISGAGFKAGVEVWMGSKKSPSAVVVSDTSIIALTPPNLEAGSLDLKVINTNGKSVSLPGALKVKSSLTVNAVTPPFLPAGVHKDTARIRGAGFSPGAKVLFGRTESPSVVVKDDEHIAAAIPPLEPGAMDVTVINQDGAKAVLFDGFQVMGEGEQTPLQAMKEEAAKYGIAGGAQDTDTGAAFADINQDGFIDLLLSNSRSAGLYAGSRDGTFTDITEDSGMKVESIVYGGYFGDLDNDGLPDIVIMGQPCWVYHNLGQGRFEEVGERVGIPHDFKGFSAAWADYDRDGLLDLFMGLLTDDDYCYHNLGGRFERVFQETFSKRLEAQKQNNRQPTTFSAAFADYDRDGWIDLFVGVRGLRSGLFSNQRGKGFEDVAEKTGITIALPGPQGATLFKPDWGIAWGDFDNDGWLDLFTTSGPVGVDLYRNREGKEFINVTKIMRAMFTPNTLSPAWGDLDNDGLLDLAVTDNLSGLRVYRNQGDGSFEDVTENLGIENGVGAGPMGMAWLDINRDGALDIFTAEYMTFNRLYINSPYPGRHYLEIELEGRKSNSMAAGAVVTAQEGSTILTRQVVLGQGYLSQPPATLHFGLGNSGHVDRLTITWPDGEVQTMDDVKADQVLTIIEAGERKSYSIPEDPPEQAPEIRPGETAEPGK